MFELDKYLVEFQHTNPLMAEFVDPATNEVIATDLHPLFKAITVCQISVPADSENEEDVDLIAEGYALCSVEDNFNKAVGRKIAFTRALELAGFDRKTRTEFWNKYLSLVKK